MITNAFGIIAVEATLGDISSLAVSSSRPRYRLGYLQYPHHYCRDLDRNCGNLDLRLSLTLRPFPIFSSFYNSKRLPSRECGNGCGTGANAMENARQRTYCGSVHHGCVLQVHPAVVGSEGEEIFVENGIQ